MRGTAGQGVTVAIRPIPAAIAIAVGALISVQSRANGEFAHTSGSSLLTAWWNISSGLTILVAFALATRSTRVGLARIATQIRARRLPWWTLCGGLFGACFLLSQSLVVPLAGVAIFAVGAVAGQTSASLLVDRLGIGASGRRHVTVNRIAASIIAIAAVAVGVSDRWGTSVAPLAVAVLAFLAGASIAPQQAFNGRTAIVARTVAASALINFLGGFLVLTPLIAFQFLAGNVHIPQVGQAPWWSMVGGLMGVAIIAGSAYVVPGLGVLVFSLLSVSGQLGAALLLDIVSPTSGTSVGARLFAGLLMTMFAIGIASAPRTLRRGAGSASE